MLVFNEGLPRSGKSYDAVLSHILPALKAGRRVFARLNGLDHDRIAAHLGMQSETVRALLTLVSTAEVKRLFVAVRPTAEVGEWTIPDELKNALFVVDECHEFYVAGRDAIDPAIENFFALCGQNGMDGLLLSQWYRRLHSSLRARIERKNVFQKLTAVGLESKYRVQRYHATGPDRFELVTADTGTYLPAIFPLYKGYADGASNTEVYKSGGQTVWRKLGKYALFVVPVVGIAIYTFMGFFGPHSGLAKNVERPVVSHSSPSHPLSGDQFFSRPVGVQHEPLKPEHGEMEPTQAYVFDLKDKARPRLLAVIRSGAEVVRGLVEWRVGQGDVIDRLTFAQIREMGVVVEVHGYGVRLVVGKDSQIVTAWPLDAPAPASAPGATPAAVQPAAAAAAAAPHDMAMTQWPAGKMPGDYIPPSLVPPVGLSDYTGR